ncbi:MAG: ATP-binding protein [Anaerolineaceae bacterium]|nr:ATP-binding protein [Anaerolineaceae bacterium]
MTRKHHEPSNVSDILRVEMPAAHAYLQMIGPSVSCLIKNARSLTRDDSLAYNIELAVHEVCTNIIEHAYGGLPGRIEMVFTVLINPPQLVIELFDNGRSFEYTSIPLPNPEEPQVRGYGLFLVQELMDQVDYCTTVDGNSWYLVKNLA